MNVGAGGSPWIQDFGPASEGQQIGREPGRNIIVGVSSYAYDDTITLANGSSIIGDSFKLIYYIACINYSGSC